MNTEFTYLASPYTPRNKKGEIVNDAATMRKRFKDVCSAAAFLMEKGEVIFCPIAHSHPIALQMETKGAATDGVFWKRQDEPYVELCSKMIVLRLSGWEQSTGVQHEIDRAKKRGIPIYYMDWEE